MESLSLPLKLLLAIVLGALIGLERESSTQNVEPGDKWGLRTYSLISLLGAIAGFLYLFGNHTLSIIITSSFFILIFIYYAVGGWMIKSMGLTTELGGIFSYLIGFFVTSAIFPIQLVIAIAIVIELILSIKEKSRSLILGIHKVEIDAFIGFAIIALVILPFLPNKPFYLTDIQFIKNLIEAYRVDVGFLSRLEIFNPFKLWLLVALITGIDLLGYILVKIFGTKNGILVQSLAGGIVSSTSMSQILARKSTNYANINELVSAATFANFSSYFVIFVLIVTLNRNWLAFVTPILIIIILASLASGLFFYIKDRKKMKIVDQNQDEQSRSIDPSHKIFSLKHAITFALVLIVIRLITKSSLNNFGNTGFLITSLLGSLTGIDAVIINLAEVAGKLISNQNAMFVLLCINTANLLGKTIFSFVYGKKEYAVKYLLSNLFITLCGFVGYFLFLY